MYFLIGSEDLSFTARFKQIIIQFPDMGFTSNESDEWQRLWTSGKSLSGVLIQRSCLLKSNLCRKTPALRPLQQGLRQVSDFQGCHSTYFLGSKMEPVGVIPDALSKVKLVSKSFVERRDQGRRRKW
jgi:hypothetical protein